MSSLRFLNKGAFLLFAFSFSLLSVSALYKEEGNFLKAKDRISASFRSFCYLDTVYFLKEDRPLVDYDKFSSSFGKEVSAQKGTYEIVSIVLDPHYVYPRYFSSIQVEVTLFFKKDRPFYLGMEFQKGGNRP